MRVHVVDPPLFTLPYDQHFCRALAAAGAEVTLIGRHLRAYERVDGEPFRFEPLFYRWSENRVSDWRTSGSRKLLKGIEHVSGLRALVRLAERERPDVLHLQWLVLPFLDRRALMRIGRRTALVLTVHDSIALHGAKNASSLQVTGDAEARLIFDHYVVHTERTALHLAGIGVAAGKVTVLSHPPLGVAAGNAGSTAAPGAPLRILFFGSIKRYKGVDVLVEAGLQLAAQGREFVIEIAGRPFEPVDDLEARIARAGADRHFRFDLRFIPDDELGGYVRGADIVVFPYREIDASGAFGVAVEAEKPIVASAVGVFAEEPARDHLRLVPSEDAGALARALGELLDDPAGRAALAQRTAELRRSLVTWDDFAARCMEIYAVLPRSGAA